MRFKAKVFCAAGIAGIVLVVFSIRPGKAGQPEKVNEKLISADQRIERHLQPRAADSIRAVMHAGQYARITIISVRSDLVVSVSGSRFPQRLTISLGAGETRRISLLSNSEEEYGIEIHSDLIEVNADYVVEMSGSRAATHADQVRSQAEVTFWHAVELANTQSADSQKQAIGSLEEASRLWHSIADDAGEAEAYTKAADLLSNLSETTKALEYSTNALQLREAVGDARGRAESLRQIANAHFNLGDRQQALKYLAEALQASLSAVSLREEANILNDFGVVYGAIGDTDKAKDHLERALLLQQQSGNRRDEASTLTNIGHNYAETGQLKQAIQTFEESLPILRQVHDRYTEAANLNDLARAHSAKGEKQTAIDLYKQSLEIERAVGDRHGEANTLNNVGKIYQDLGDNAGALRNYQDAIRIVIAIADRQLEMVTRARIASIKADSGDRLQALDDYTSALKLAEATNDKRWRAIILNYIARLQYMGGNSETAVPLYEKAIAIQRETRNRLDLPNVLINAGDAQAALNHTDTAISSYKEALSICQDIGDSDMEARALFAIAKIQSKTGKYAEGRPLLESALEKVESLRGEIAVQSLKTSYSASIRDYFELYIDTLMQLDRGRNTGRFINRALEASEHSRARTMLELLQTSHVDFRQGTDPNLLEKEHDLRYRLALYSERRMASAARDASAEKLRKLSEQVSELEARYAEVQASIRRMSPQYASLTQPSSLSAADIQSQIANDNTTVLEYFLGNQRSFLWVADRSGIHGFELVGREEIEQAARRFYAIVSSRDAQIQGQNESKIASHLSRLILGPAATLIGAKHLVVIPDGALEFIPFAALPFPGSRDTELLLARHEITYGPSATVLSTLRGEAKKRTVPEKLVAVFADPVFSAEDPRLNPVITSVRRNREIRDASLERSVAETTGSEVRATRGLPRLPFSRMEAEWIYSLGASKQKMKALDFDANLSAATGPQLRDYRFVHFATHGLLNTEDPMLSGLVLSLFDKNGKSQPGFLKMSDLYNLKLSADLVVLSACQTGLGKTIRSEGLVGLTRGFMYAGADRVLASVWNINDLATAELMRTFYELVFRQHLKPAAALRRAQLTFLDRKDRSSPYYWAGFLLQGDWN